MMRGMMKLETGSFRVKGTLTCKAAVAGKVATSSTKTSNAVTQFPSPAQTARSVLAIATEGTLSTLTAEGVPLGTPVSFAISKKGEPSLYLSPNSPELRNLGVNNKCSLLVQPITSPARGVAAVSLLGKVDTTVEDSAGYPFHVERCIYFGGLDQTTTDVPLAELEKAEPDALMKAAPELIQAWNGERAEDIYRIVSHFLKVPLSEMAYAELLWVDSLGMYVRCETMAGSIRPTVVRVPFYRAAIDERDARSVITMAAQMAWEAERNYVPPLPSAMGGTAAGAAK